MTKLSKETQESVFRVLREKDMAPNATEVLRVEKRWPEEWLVFVNDGGGAWVMVDRYRTDEERAILQRAADETAGRLPEGRPTQISVHMSDENYAAAAKAWDEIGAWRGKSLPVPGRHAGELTHLDSILKPFTARIRGAMEAMSNVAKSMYLVAQRVDKEDYQYRVGQSHEARNLDSLTKGGASRASQRWSDRVREGVKALKPKVQVYCAGDWEED